MGHPLRVLGAGAIYHVIGRGNNRRPVFLEDAGHAEFLELFGELSKKFDWTTHAYCLMGNHFHIALTTNEANLSDGMRELMGRFSRWHNTTYGRSGHLFGGRYRAKLIRDDRQLLSVARYIVRNPVAAGLVEAPQDWEWSNYRAIVGISPGQAFLSPDVVLGVLHRRPLYARVLFRAFVEEPLPSDVQPGGGPHFYVPAPSPRPSARAIVAAMGTEMGVRACLALGHGHGQIAEAVGLSRSAISRRRGRGPDRSPRVSDTGR